VVVVVAVIVAVAVAAATTKFVVCLFVGRRFQAFVDDDGERDVVQIRCLNFQVTL